MDKHTHSRYDEELQNLQNMIMEMARLTESQLHSIYTFLRQDEDAPNTLQDIKNIDQRVNQYHIGINLEAIRLIAKRAPVAVDLRCISANFRIATDLERIGDECCKIARFLTQADTELNTRIWKEIRPAARLAKNLLKRTVNMLGRNDSDEAHSLLKDDEELDSCYHSTARVLASYMLESPSSISQGIDVLMAAKALERVGDHCINIAEAIIFAQEGQDIRHQANSDIAAVNG